MVERLHILKYYKKNLINLGPHQPKLNVLPSDGKNKFCPEWYEEFEFLEYSTSKDAAFCFVCYLFPVGVGRNKSEPAWRTEGVRNWRKIKNTSREKSGKLKLHFNSSAHKAALFEYCNFLVKAGHIDILLDKEKRNLVLEEENILVFNRHVVKMLFDITQTLAKQGIAFRGNVDEDGNFTQIVKLPDKVGHNVIFIPCQAHQTNTAVEHSCRASTIISDTFDILEELYVFFSSSTKKFHRLKAKL